MKALYYQLGGIQYNIFFYLTHFRSLGQKSKNNFVRFLVQMRTRKFASEIYSPLQLKETKTGLGWIVQFVPTFNKKYKQQPTDRVHKKQLKLHVYEI